MSPAARPRGKHVRRLLNATGVTAAAGILAASLWLVAEEWRAENEMRSAALSLAPAAADPESGTRSKLLAELIDAQKRAELPLAVDAPRKLEDLTKRLSDLSVESEADSTEIAVILADAGSATVEAEPPSASFTAFRHVPHQIILVGAGARGSSPVYSFRRDFEGSAFPSEHFTDIRKGQVFCGWKVVASETPSIPGKIVEVKVGERKSGPIFEKRQLPSFGIDRLRLVESDTGREETVTAPRSERDRQAAELSGHEFRQYWSGQTPTGEITMTGPGGTEVLTVRAGDEFNFLEQTFRVVSVQPGKLELWDKQADRPVVWGRKQPGE